jgi:hypothetical protein
VEARNLRSGSSLEFMMPAGGRRVPFEVEGVVDDGAHGTRSGKGGTPDADRGPWMTDARSARSMRPLFPLPDAPVIVQAREGKGRPSGTAAWFT